ncbi:uncharacterized protein [Penaeus vannamei]|uniref:uncharacterized protein n=1 Tax=Penaeus vannamei TaxID=6689 RepID=UPI00387F4C54
MPTSSKTLLQLNEQKQRGAKQLHEPSPPAATIRQNTCGQNSSSSSKDPDSTNDDSGGNSTLGTSYDFNISEVFQCNNFGIVDCLTSVIKEPDTDDSESCSSDYGSGLGTSPPAKFSDTDSAIETLAVSSDLPLKGFPTPRPSALARRKKPDMGSIRWRSCAELTQKYRPSPASSVLKRQWSDRSLQARLQEQALRGMSVEVYDGDVGVSVLTLSRNSSSALRRGQRNAKAGPEGDVAAEVEAKLLRDESGESQDLHDSLAVEASGSDFEVDGEEEDEAMETDECAPVTSTGPPPGPRTASRRTRTSSRQRKSTGPRAKMSSKGKEQEGSVSSTTGRGSASPACAKRPLKDDVMLAIKIGHMKDKEMDHVLGIQEDDGSGPGLSEEELELSTSPPRPALPAPLGEVLSPQPHLWSLQKESRRRAPKRISEACVHRVHPHLRDAGKSVSKAVLIAPAEFRLGSSGRDAAAAAAAKHVSVSDTSRTSSTRSSSRPSRVYSGASKGATGDSSAEDSDASGAELSELERCVLSLTHRRSQLRKQDTNAFLLAPAEFRISSEDMSALPEIFRS